MSTKQTPAIEFRNVSIWFDDVQALQKVSFSLPPSGLDPINARQVLDLIIRARDLHQTSSLLVTKALHEIPYLATHHAREDRKGGSIVEITDHLPTVHLCLLEKGRITFFGSPREFTRSALPAVQHMLHPQTNVLHDQLDIADPWRQNLRTRVTQGLQ